MTPAHRSPPAAAPPLAAPRSGLLLLVIVMIVGLVGMHSLAAAHLGSAHLPGPGGQHGQPPAAGAADPHAAIGAAGTPAGRRPLASTAGLPVPGGGMTAGRGMAAGGGMAAGDQADLPAGAAGAAPARPAVSGPGGSAEQRDGSCPDCSAHVMCLGLPRAGGQDQGTQAVTGGTAVAVRGPGLRAGQPQGAVGSGRPARPPSLVRLCISRT